MRHGRVINQPLDEKIGSLLSVKPFNRYHFAFKPQPPREDATRDSELSRLWIPGGFFPPPKPQAKLESQNWLGSEHGGAETCRGHIPEHAEGAGQRQRSEGHKAGQGQAPGEDAIFSARCARSRVPTHPPTNPPTFQQDDSVPKAPTTSMIDLKSAPTNLGKGRPCGCACLFSAGNVGISPPHPRKGPCCKCSVLLSLNSARPRALPWGAGAIKHARPAEVKYEKSPPGRTQLETVWQLPASQSTLTNTNIGVLFGKTWPW